MVVSVYLADNLCVEGKAHGVWGLDNNISYCTRTLGIILYTFISAERKLAPNSEIHLAVRCIQCALFRVTVQPEIWVVFIFGGVAPRKSWLNLNLVVAPRSVLHLHHHEHCVCVNLSESPLASST